ncbi:MAG: hydrolase 2, exosortase A system-associated [Thiobacillus sp.]|nr:hydrolase 2, exosortase A system-associated [Thiobacillus sp.]
MDRADIRIEPFFLDSPRGPLFCLYTAPAEQRPQGAVLYLHPFAEEMHKSRRMAALQARAMAARGYAVLQIDLTGCGDSAGDFSDASWSAWLDDARLAHACLHEKAALPVTLWGLRTGALLAADLARQLLDIHGLLLWQPVSDGSLFLNQFLRIKLASEMLSEGQSKSGTKELLAQLEAGQGVEVGGNMLSPAMARELGGLKLAHLVPQCPVTWLEVGALAGEHLSPASQHIADSWREAGAAVQSRTVAGDPFWATQEITECWDLIEATNTSE